MRKAILSMADIAACPDVLKPLDSIGDVVELPASQEVLVERIHEFDAFLTSLTVETNRAVLQAATKLQVIATASTGRDHIDVSEAERRGITVLSLKDDIEFLRSITSTAELTWALLLAVVRKLPAAIAAARQGRWGRDEFRGTQLSGKTLGIVGYGRLGRMVAEYGRAFGMRTLVCDVRPLQTPVGVEQVTFDELLQRSDVVSIHVHLSNETRHLLDAKAFASMKPGAILVNTSRGGVIDEAALLNALESGHLAGAGLDVIDGEWRNDLVDHPLIRYASHHENLLISPHIGGVTCESQALAYGRIVQKLIEFFGAASGTSSEDR
ncbi:MAG: NAD(P)-dependent oxidoreductase [Pirellulales bacterium]